MVQNARDLLEERETLLLIFTDGINLDLDTGDGYASTGWWRMSEQRNPDRVSYITSTHLDMMRVSTSATLLGKNNALVIDDTK